MASNKKQIGKNQPPQPKMVSQPEPKKLIGAANNNQLLIEEVLPNFASPTWNEQDFYDLHLSILEGSRDRFAALVEQMASFGKALNAANDFVKTKSEKLTIESSRIEIDRCELLQLKETCEKRAADLDEKELLLTIKNGENASKERELEQRELDARSGFAAQNIAALKDLKKEIVELESKKTEIQLGILQAEQKARDYESVCASELMDREAEIANKERSLQQQQRRQDAEWKELERERTQVREDARREANQEIARLTEARQRAESRLEKVYRDWTLTEQKLEQYREFSEALAGRSAREIVDELAAHKRRVTQLENQIANSQDDQLQSENDALRKLRDEQKTQLDEVHVDLADAKAQLYRLRLGVSDKENLEKEKRALEKNNQILSARLNDLGKTVDDLTQSQQSEKPFPQMAWMDSASNADWIKDRKAKELSLPEQDVPDLKKFSGELQHRIAQAEEGSALHFRLEDIQLLIAGLAMSQLHIFQGISGTGKTSLAKAFAKAVGGQCTDIAVQAGWRDRDDLLGHYNAFEKRFYERDCLQGLYRAQTEPPRV